MWFCCFSRVFIWNFSSQSMHSLSRGNRKPDGTGHITWQPEFVYWFFFSVFFYYFNTLWCSTPYSRYIACAHNWTYTFFFFFYIVCQLNKSAASVIAFLGVVKLLHHFWPKNFALWHWHLKHKISDVLYEKLCQYFVLKWPVRFTNWGE